MLAAPPDASVAAVRHFNRFYTRLVGALDEGHLRSDYSLTEVRLLYEIAHRDAPTATELTRDLALDAGYLSRLLQRLEERGILARTASASDARRSHLALTRSGRALFRRLDAWAHDAVAELLAPLGDREHEALLDAMRTIEQLLDRPRAPEDDAPLVLREPRPGDLGWVVERHGVLYDREYGWGAPFEALVARVVADFATDHDPARERAWIAEHEGARAGSVLLVRHPDRVGVAKLRLLLVEPRARGHGIGQALVRECTRFAREAGYHTITLWTNAVLASARRLYEAEGYRLVHEEAHTLFGKGEMGQTWELAL